jgi:phosphate transport system permease protein
MEFKSIFVCGMLLYLLTAVLMLLFRATSSYFSGKA